MLRETGTKPRLADEDRAIQAFGTCLRYQPSAMRAHRYLARLYLRKPGAGNLAALHQERLRGRTERRGSWLRFRQSLRHEARERARVRAEARRQRRENVLALPPEPAEPPSKSAEALEILIVSGLPRSGTSLMMQMLEAAGLPIMRDGLRPADESNPRGYYEWQEIKQLPNDSSLIEKAHGHVVKVISMLLPSLPRRHRFRVVFMNRNIGDVLASQQKMRSRLSGAEAADGSALRERMSAHRERMLELLRSSSNVELLEVDYDALLASPLPVLQQVAKFAAINEASIEQMATLIDPSLRHSPRAENPGETAHRASLV